VDLVNSYAEAKVGIIQESSLTNFMWKMDGVILPQLGQLRAMNITPKRIDQYIGRRLKSKNRRGGSIKRTTIHREISDIKAVLNWAERRQYIAFNPITKYEMPKRDDAIILPPSPDEIKSILKHSPDRLLRAISLSYYTGLRPGRRELYSLKWSDVDFTGGTIMVTSAKKGGHFKYRMVPIHPDFVEVLNQWRDQDNNPDGPIIHYRKKPVKSLKKIFNQVKEKAGINRRLTMYSFRHAFATLLLKHNADLKSTSELLGHSRTDTTTRIYQHVDFEMHKEAVKKLPAIDLTIHKSMAE
jgi:integrase